MFSRSPYGQVTNVLSAKFDRCSRREIDAALKEVRKQNGGTFGGMSVVDVVESAEPILEQLLHELALSQVVAAAPPGFDDAQRSESVNCCCICQEPMVDGSVEFPITESQCGHRFHTECLRPWLDQNAICPLCKEHILMPDEFPALS